MRTRLRLGLLCVASRASTAFRAHLLILLRQASGYYKMASGNQLLTSCCRLTDDCCKRLMLTLYLGKPAHDSLVFETLPSVIILLVCRVFFRLRLHVPSKI